MAGRFIISIASSAFISFFAWIAVQLHRPLGALLFSAALLLPPIVFREYYTKRPRMLVPFFAVSFVLMVLLAPPPVMGPNVEFGLHFAMGCEGREGNTWPLSGEELAYSCNKPFADSTISISGVAWRSSRVRLPVLGRYVTLHEPRGKADNAYREATERVESEGYLKLVENYGTYSHIIEDVLFAKDGECIYLAETKILGGGFAVLSARGPCRGVKGFALRWHDDYLWNASEPPTFREYRFNWSSSGSVRVGRFLPSDWPNEWVKNTYKAIEIELKGTGYVKRMEGKSGNCRWSLWRRDKKAHYVSLRGKEILVISGETKKVRNSVEKISPCGMKNAREVHEPTPEEVLNSVIKELNGSFVIKSPKEPSLWSLAGKEVLVSVGKKNVSVSLLVYGVRWQCDYARYLLDTSDETTSVCLERDGYFVTVAVKGDVEGVNAVLSSMKRLKKT